MNMLAISRYFVLLLELTPTVGQGIIGYGYILDACRSWYNSRMVCA